MWQVARKQCLDVADSLLYISIANDDVYGFSGDEKFQVRSVPGLSFRADVLH